MDGPVHWQVVVVDNEAPMTLDEVKMDQGLETMHFFPFFLLQCTMTGLVFKLENQLTHSQLNSCKRTGRLFDSSTEDGYDVRAVVLFSVFPKIFWRIGLWSLHL